MFIFAPPTIIALIEATATRTTNYFHDYSFCCCEYHFDYVNDWCDHYCYYDYDSDYEYCTASTITTTAAANTATTITASSSTVAAAANNNSFYTYLFLFCIQYCVKVLTHLSLLHILLPKSQPFSYVCNVVFRYSSPGCLHTVPQYKIT